LEDSDPCTGAITTYSGKRAREEAREEVRAAAASKAEETISEEAAMIHQIGDVEIEVVLRPTDFKIDTVYDCCGRARVKEVPMYKATVVGRRGVWGHGRSPAEAIGNVILTCPGVFAAPVLLDLPRPEEFFVPPIKSR